MSVDVVERRPNVRELLGLTPVGDGIPSTSRHFIYPLSGLEEEVVSSGTLLYSEGEESTRAILLLSGVAIVTLPSPKTADSITASSKPRSLRTGDEDEARLQSSADEVYEADVNLERKPLTFSPRKFINWEFVAAPALIGEEALSPGTYLGSAKVFTVCRLQEVFISHIWDIYTNPTDARTLALAQANRTSGRRPWAGLLGEAAPGRIDFLLRYLEALTTESKIPYLRQDDFASSIGISRETFNKELKNPRRRQLFDKIVENFLPRDRENPIFSI